MMSVLYKLTEQVEALENRVRILESVASTFQTDSQIDYSRRKATQEREQMEALGRSK